MNSFQIIATISLCLLVFSGVVSTLVLLGIPLFAAFVIVYLAAVWYMAGMQRRAREWADSQQPGNRHVGRHHIGRHHIGRHSDQIRVGNNRRVLRAAGSSHRLKA